MSRTSQRGTGSGPGAGTPGAQGPPGNDGAAGAQGIQGVQGNAGAQGVQGNAGAAGSQGIQGIQGIQGVTGAAGADAAATPAMFGLIAMTGLPSSYTTTTPLTTQVAYVMKISCPAKTITHIDASLVTGGTGLVSGQNWAAIYDFAVGGTRRGLTADMTTAWATADGARGMALASSYVFGGGYLYVALLSCGTGPAGFARGVSGSVQNNPGTHVTTLPAAGTMAGALTAMPATLPTLSWTSSLSFFAGLRGT